MVEDARFDVTAELLAAIAYGERRGAERAESTVGLAPDPRAAGEQRQIASREAENCALIEARLRELGSEAMAERYGPYFDTFFAATEPADWLEAQTFHYVGDALVSDFADGLAPLVDRVSAEVIRQALGDREIQEAFALDELTRLMGQDPEAAGRIGAYARRIVGEGFTQTARALEASATVRGLLGDDAGKRFVLGLLDGHRRRLDRLGIEPVGD